MQVDGNDLLAVYVAAEEAVNRARSGDGPTLIECLTYRMSVHTTADDPSRYRSEEEVEKWEQRDPLRRLQIYLKNRKLISDDDIEELEEEVEKEIKKAIESWESQKEDLGDPLNMFDHLFAELPPYVRRQRDELEKMLLQQTAQEQEDDTDEEDPNE